MATRDNNPKLRLYPDVFDESRHTEEFHIEKGLKMGPDMISGTVTWLLGQRSEKLPMTFSTEGLGNKEYIKSLQYYFPVINDIDKGVSIAETINTGTPGKNWSTFQVKFSSNWFIKQHVIAGPSQTMCRVTKDPERDGVTNSWIYTLEPITSDAGDYVPHSDLAAGTVWAAYYVASAASGSTGTDHRFMFPSKMQNQINTYRRGYNFKGNSQRRVMNIEINGMKLWADWEEFQFMTKMQEEVEQLYWYSKWNRDSQGNVHNFDEGGNQILNSAGILEQIPNHEEYAELTESKLHSTIRDIFFGIRDADAKNVVLYTGTMGMEEFHKALNSAASPYTHATGNKFVTGDGRNLSFGAYFNTYNHIDGHSVTVRKLPLLDYGPEAKSSPKHPDTGKPLSSYKMIFLDQSSYDGEANIKQVTREGREMIRKGIPGMEVPRGFKDTDTVGSDFDGAGVQYLKECGICIKRATNCVTLDCVKGLN